MITPSEFVAACDHDNCYEAHIIPASDAADAESFVVDVYGWQVGNGIALCESHRDR